MSRLNIPSTIQDPAYRYTMPKMSLRQESRLNGVKTNIENLYDLAGALRVPELVIMKYFCAELGASHVQGSVMTGQHAYEQLLKTLDKFIHAYVLCKKCNYPELQYKAEKKDLFGKCNSCSNLRRLDNQHKAGKQLLKDVPTFNPSGVDINTSDQMKIDDVPKKSKKGAMIEEEKEMAGGKAGKKKAKEEEIPVVEFTLQSPEIDEAILNFDQFVNEEERTIDDLLDEVRRVQTTLGATADFKYYILFCGLFQGKRNCVKHWPQYESAFLRLVQLDGEVGPKRLLQTICCYFCVKQPTMQKYISTFFRMLYDQAVFSDELVIGWQKDEIKSDKKCCMYVRKAEKVFRPLLQEYADWLQSGEAEEYDEEEAEEEETKTAAPVKKEESEADRQQRELIEQQQKRMLEQMEAQKAKAEEAKALEAEKKKEQAGAVDVEDVTKIEVGDDDDFDIDNI